MLQLVLLLFAN